MKAMYELFCPECGKHVGDALTASAAREVILWCKRCKQAVTPTPEPKSHESEQEE